jgi:hypothetical protein
MTRPTRRRKRLAVVFAACILIASCGLSDQVFVNLLGELQPG